MVLKCSFPKFDIVFGSLKIAQKKYHTVNVIILDFAIIIIPQTPNCQKIHDVQKTKHFNKMEFYLHTNFLLRWKNLN